MLLLILFCCKLIEAATKSEKKAVAALTKEFLEPFSAMSCQENPNPEVRLWHNMGYPETQFMPTYETLNEENYKEKLHNQGRRKHNVFFEINHVSQQLNMMKVKQSLEDGANVMSMDVCVRDGQNITVLLIHHKNRTNSYRKVSTFSLISVV